MPPRTVALIDLNAGQPNRAMPLLSRMVADAGADACIYDPRLDGVLPGRRHAAYILSGGPGSPVESAPWRDRLLPVCRAWRSPVLGICLGFQVLAAAHGWRIQLARRPRFGPYPLPATPSGRSDPLLSRMAGNAVIFEQRRWAVRPPAAVRAPGAALLSVDDEGEVLAARLSHWAIGTTFHPEASPDVVAAWFDSDETARTRLAERQGEDALDGLDDRILRLGTTWETVIPGFLARSLRGA